MSKEYAEDKIREALRMHGGNIALARQQVMNWANDNARLLQGLTRPHLDGIVAYQVERVASGRAELEKRHPSAAAEPKPNENFGMDLLRAVAAADAAIFGQESSSNSGKRVSASKQHIEAIHKLAASRSKDDRKNR